MKRALIAAVGLVALQGCASNAKINAYVLNNQQEMYQNGQKTVVSQQKSTIAIRPTETTYYTNQRPSFTVGIFNGTNRASNFSTENIRVFVNGKPHKVFTYEELIAEAKSAQNTQILIAALSGMAQIVNASNAGHTYHSGSYSTNLYNNYGGSAHGYGSYSGYSYDQGAVLRAQNEASRQTISNAQSIKNQGDRQLNNLDRTMLKKTTVRPQSWYGGDIRIEKITKADPPNEIKIIVGFAGDEHQFLFRHFEID